MIAIAMVEDDPELSGLLCDFLGRHGMAVDSFPRPDAFFDAIAAKHYDLAIIDLTLPRMDGLEICSRLQETHLLPYIISSARTDLADKLIGLERGADDYLPKPYDPRELVARIHTVLRRYRHPSVQTDASPLHIDTDKMEITLKGVPLPLTTAEYEVLALLIARRGCVLSRDAIADNVSAMKWESTERSIDVVVSRIRKKLGDNPKAPQFIKAVKGAGYKFIG